MPFDLAPGEVEAFLAGRHGRAVTGLVRLHGGAWSAAYGYRVGDRDLVARFGTMRDAFEMDRLAMRFGRPGLPVPEVLEVGEGLGTSYAISVRHSGGFLEDVAVTDAAAASATLARLLDALRRAGGPVNAPSCWYPPGADPRTSTWRGWLAERLADDPRHVVSGWRAALAEHPEHERLFVASCERIHGLLDACPERRDLVHGDLLHRNVLVAPRAREITAVFSWKCSVLGDFLYDVAWCTFWAPWHAGIAAARPWETACAAGDLTGTELVDAATRHHCYEVHVGATHLAWNAWTGDTAALSAVAARLSEILARGPLPMP